MLKETAMTHYRWIKWLLFVCFIFTIPVPPFFLPLGVIPVAAIAFVALCEFFKAFPSLILYMVYGIMIGVQALIPGGLFYFAARGIARSLCGALPKNYAVLSATVLIGGLIVASSFDIYRLEHDRPSPPTNLPGVARQAALLPGSPFALFFRDRGRGVVPLGASKGSSQPVLYRRRGAGLIEVHPPHGSGKQERDSHSAH